MKKNNLLVVGLLAVSSCVYAQGQSASSNYIGVDGGYAWVDIKADQTAQTLANLSGRTTSYSYDKAAVFGRLFGGINISKNLDIELGVFSTGNLKANYSNSLGTANESYNARGIDLSLVLRPAPTGLYAKIGAHSSRVNGNASVRISTFSATASGSNSGTGLFGGIGYDYKLTEDLVGSIGYSYYDKVGGVSGANASILSVGIAKKF